VSHSSIAQHGNRNNTLIARANAQNVPLQECQTRARTGSISTGPAYTGGSTSYASHARRTRNAASERCAHQQKHESLPPPTDYLARDQPKPPTSSLQYHHQCSTPSSCATTTFYISESCSELTVSIVTCRKHWPAPAQDRQNSRRSLTARVQRATTAVTQRR
jgi:hypothetical protein